MGLGFRTLLEKEVRRFLRVPGQTLGTPLVQTVLYFLVFGYSLGSRLREVDGIPYARFIVPGLVLMGVITNAYINSASSLFVMKLQGTVVDLLVSPLSYGQILAAFVLAASLRGLLVGAITFAVASAFTGLQVASPLAGLGVATLAAVSFAALGVMTAIWAQTFEQVNFFPTFLIMPLTFLGGVFYALHMLPAALRAVTLANPIFYVVDRMRGALLGVSEAAALPGWGLLLGLAVGALAGAYAMLASGYRLRG
jgi:ABC-2 type transport system permease protein